MYLSIHPHTADSFRKQLTNHKMVIGRGKHCNVSIPDTTLSKYHCEIDCILGQYFIKDLGSKNGTFVNDVRINTAVRLYESDHVKIGSTRMQLSASTRLKQLSFDDAQLYNNRFTPYLTIRDGQFKGVCYPITQDITMIGKRDEQVAIVAKNSVGLFITHLEGDALLLNYKPLHKTSSQLFRGDNIVISGTTISVIFSETPFVQAA